MAISCLLEITCLCVWVCVCTYMCMVCVCLFMCAYGISVHVLCTHRCTDAHVCAQIGERQRWALAVILSYILFLRWSLSLNLELNKLATLTRQRNPGVHISLPPQHRDEIIGIQGHTWLFKCVLRT